MFSRTLISRSEVIISKLLSRQCRHAHWMILLYLITNGKYIECGMEAQSNVGSVLQMACNMPMRS